jgi:ribosomal protein S7
VAKLITKLTKCGKKEKAEKHFIFIFNQLKLYLKKRHPLVLYLNILKLLATPLILITKRVGKNFYKIPIPLKPYNSYIKALT